MAVLVLCCTTDNAKPGHQKHSYRGSKIQQECMKVSVEAHCHHRELGYGELLPKELLLMWRKASLYGICGVYPSSLLPLTTTIQKVEIQRLGLSLDRKDP